MRGRGGGGGGRGGAISRGLNREDYVAFNYHIVTEYSVTVASVLRLKHHHPTMRMLWGHRCRSKRQKYIYIKGSDNIIFKKLRHHRNDKNGR